MCWFLPWFVGFVLFILRKTSPISYYTRISINCNLYLYLINVFVFLFYFWLYSTLISQLPDHASLSLVPVNWVCLVLLRYELGRQPANTKLSSNKTVRRVRVRGGNVKWRALRLDTGNYSWGSEAVTRKTRILDVVYNASNNELVRTQTLVKSAIVQVDAAPFKQWYLQHYGVDIGRKKKTSAATKKEGEVRQYVFIVCCFTVFHYKYSVYFLPFFFYLSKKKI